MMTKVAKLFEQEKQQAIKEVTKEVAIDTAKAMIQEGDSIEKIAQCVKELSIDEIKVLVENNG